MLNFEPKAFGRSVALPTGTLDVEVAEFVWPLEQLCDFAARENPKRGFLVVSRVLGRHIPARPAVMRNSVRDLVRQIPTDLPGPVMVVGLAETAVCLGQTLHEDYTTQTCRADIGFLHSTRQILDEPLLCRFEEPHSHASAHLVYRPRPYELGSPRSLVIVDDEVSTGTTLQNLAAALTESWPSVETIVVATLTDWSAATQWLDRMPRPTEVVALLTGSLTWRPTVQSGSDLAFEHRATSLGSMERHFNSGRLGLRRPLDRPPAGRLPAGSGPLRIVGTGEFTYLPFRLAERLEAAGRDVVVQATSRSPVRQGGAMAHKLSFEDNYRTGVPNFLYNADPVDGRETWICHETGAGTVDPRLVEALKAELVEWTV